MARLKRREARPAPKFRPHKLAKPFTDVETQHPTRLTNGHTERTVDTLPHYPPSTAPPKRDGMLGLQTTSLSIDTRPIRCSAVNKVTVAQQRVDS